MPQRSWVYVRRPEVVKPIWGLRPDFLALFYRRTTILLNLPELRLQGWPAFWQWNEEQRKNDKTTRNHQKPHTCG